MIVCIIFVDTVKVHITKYVSYIFRTCYLTLSFQNTYATF